MYHETFCHMQKGYHKTLKCLLPENFLRYAKGLSQEFSAFVFPKIFWYTQKKYNEHFERLTFCGRNRHTKKCNYIRIASVR